MNNLNGFLRNILILLYLSRVGFVKSELNSVDTESGSKIKHLDEEGPGDPLFLSPYINNGRFEEGRRLAEVPSFVSDPLIRSWAGYLTVNNEYNSNLFFWYFESERNPVNDPTVIWLQGGPGSSSLFGLFNENGPYIITKEKTLVRRKYSWSKVSNLIFFDNPVGTGYSFTEDKLGFATNQTQVGDDLYSAIVQLFNLFPHLQKNDLYITGESYAGKYVPAFGHAIQRNNRKASNGLSLKIKLRGLMIGNAWTDPINMLKYSSYLFQLGLIDNNARKEINKIEKKAISYIKKKDWRKANELIDKIVGDETSLFYKYTGLTGYYNYFDTTSGDWANYEEEFVRSDLFRKSIHVGNRTYNNGVDVYINLYEDVAKSVINWVVELLRDYRVLFYNGQLDIICAYPLTVSYLTNMKWPLHKQYLKAKRFVYKVNDDVAGYYKSVGHLTEVLIRDAGHMVPTDQPVWALQLLTDFIHKNITFYNEQISDEKFKKHNPYFTVV